MTGTTQANPVLANAQAEQILLNSGIQMIRQLPSVSISMGSANQEVKLQRLGITTNVTLHVTATLSVTTALVASPFAPWNLFSRVAYRDFAGVSRISTNPFQLAAMQMLKSGDALGASAFESGNPSNMVFNKNTNILQLPAAGATGTQTLEFTINVPMAYNPSSDLRGAILAQLNIGDHSVLIDALNNLVGTDPWASPFISGAATVTSINIDAFQHYIQPQSMSAASIPTLSLATIYGIENLNTSNNINSNQDYYLSYPNARSIISTLFNFENGGAFTQNETDVSKVTLLTNGNTAFREMTPRLIREMMRMSMKADLPSSTYYISSRSSPIMTNLFAAVQLKLAMGTVNAGVTQFVVQNEMFYPSGQPLPGIVA